LYVFIIYDKILKTLNLNHLDLIYFDYWKIQKWFICSTRNNL